MIVQKFGGSSLATPEQIRAVAKNVSALHKAGKKIILVTSAMGKTTNELTELAYKVSSRPHRRELDMLLTTGERVSMALMAMALNDLGCPAISFTGSQAGILTDGAFLNAQITELRPVRVAEALKQNKIVVLAGFQGVDPKTKEITTLGRGGSDTTAVAMAHHFRAERCEVLKDVDGVYSCDPKIVPQAQLFKTLHVDHLYNFCFWGAKVLNYRAVEWVKKYKIPLAVGRSDNFKIGTMITHEARSKVKFKNQRVREFSNVTSAGTLLGVHSHNWVMEIALPAPKRADGLRLFANTLKEHSLAHPQILENTHEGKTLRLLLALDADARKNYYEAMGNSKKIEILVKEAASVTATFSDSRNETLVVPHEVRVECIQKVTSSW